jgi:hypothetical protein
MRTVRGHPGDVRRSIVIAMVRADEALDEVLYRPAVVKAFMWLPRWWLCDLAKLSIALDHRWGVDYWNDDGIWPGGPCDACGRRASIHVYGGLHQDEEPVGDYLDEHPVHVCGWCQLCSPLANESDVQRELRQARARSVAWRWRWPARP